MRLLLDALPPPPEGEIPQTDSARLSPTGWSDLPSDAEDTFFFSPDEAEDYHREKRRRLIDQSREERLRALHAESDDVGDDHDDDPWGGSDEEVHVIYCSLVLYLRACFSPTKPRGSLCDAPPHTF